MDKNQIESLKEIIEIQHRAIDKLTPVIERLNQLADQENKISGLQNLCFEQSQEIQALKDRTAKLDFVEAQYDQLKNTALYWHSLLINSPHDEAQLRYRTPFDKAVADGEI